MSDAVEDTEVGFFAAGDWGVLSRRLVSSAAA
jgi:hypothetical protein